MAASFFEACVCFSTVNQSVKFVCLRDDSCLVASTRCKLVDHDILSSLYVLAVMRMYFQIDSCNYIGSDRNHVIEVKHANQLAL